MITLSLLLAMLGIGFCIRKLFLLIVGSVRKAAQVQAVEQVSVAR